MIFVIPLILSFGAFASSGTLEDRLIVGCEGPASRDGRYFHSEISADGSRDSSALLAAAITGSRWNVGSVCKVYSSADGGATWTDTETLEQREFGGADPQVAFGPDHWAYFSVLSSGPRDASTLDVYRSRDGGETWAGPSHVGEASVDYDHDKIAVDWSSPRFAGRIYVAALYSIPYRIGLFTSDDEGLTFAGPVDAAVGPDTMGINVSRPVILSDGTLFVPFFDFPLNAPTTGAITSTIRFTVSTDGGCVYSAPREIGERRVDPGSPHSGEMDTDPVFAVDRESSEFADRLYAVWTDSLPGGSRIVLTFSSDRGAHWSAPLTVDDGGPPGSRQFQPALAVNADGVVAVSWLDTRNTSDGSGYDAYITASKDGGRSFLPSRRLSSESSFPERSTLDILPTSWRSRLDGRRVTLFAPAGRFEAGGDYCEMAVEKSGDFHPFWPDHRNGFSQIWTCPVRLGARPVPPPGGLTEVTLDNELVLDFDTPSYEASKMELRLPVHLRNISSRPVWGPLRVTIRAFGSGTGAHYLENTPEVLNSDNGSRGAGAAFDFSRALGDESRLNPGARTAQVTWIFRLKNPLRTPDLHISVTGRVLRNSPPSAAERPPN
ncbi:MAG TPA: sialidase family protein [Thermoanaerobaculia bacterium]|nr:sialidase family protein [Thermoanaerobaculia bacterium]